MFKYIKKKLNKKICLSNNLIFVKPHMIYVVLKDSQFYFFKQSIKGKKKRDIWYSTKVLK
ncbi:hypothetical protein EC396_04500 [Lutibacter sp. HS1-25]|nr:hypothetical protein EC396_04500 [Lutibacter sp. HS1-25]